MLSLLHENLSSDRPGTPLNAAEEIQNWIQRDDPPTPPPKKAFAFTSRPHIQRKQHSGIQAGNQNASR